MRSKSNKQKIAALLAASLVTQYSFQASAGERVLKMRAHIGAITARPIALPTGEVVDFPYVANALFYSQVFQHGYFEESNFLEEVLDDVSKASANVNGEFSTKSLAADATSDAQMLARYGFTSSQQSSSSGSHGFMKSSAATTSPANVPRCQYNEPVVKLKGQVIAFEQGFGGGITVGYSQNQQHLPAGVGGTFGLKTQRLDMQFDAVDPMYSRAGMNVVMATAAVDKTISDFNFGISLPLGIPIGINFFTKGSISNGIRKAMKSGLDNLIKEFQKYEGGGGWKKAWKSRVIYSKTADNDDTVAIAGGKRAYIKVGDQFRVTNMFWSWSGVPCESRLKGDTMPSARLGEAIGTVIEIGDYASVLRVTPVNGHEQSIMPGAIVTIEKLN